MPDDLDSMTAAIRKAMPGAVVSTYSSTAHAGACPDCLGDGVVPIVDGHADGLADCKRCLGYGFASYGEPAEPGELCTQCNGEGSIETLLFNGNPYTDACDRCGGSGWYVPAIDIDDADHAEYVDPIDHSHDVAISSEAAVARLAAVLDIHRRTEDHVCAAEPHVVFPCPTARAALGVK